MNIAGLLLVITASFASIAERLWKLWAQQNDIASPAEHCWKGALRFVQTAGYQCSTEKRKKVMYQLCLIMTLSKEKKIWKQENKARQKGKPSLLSKWLRMLKLCRHRRTAPAVMNLQTTRRQEQQLMYLKNRLKGKRLCMQLS